MKKIFYSFILMFSLCQSITAAEPYATLTGSANNKTLTFYYGERTNHTFPIAERYGSESDRQWDNDTLNIQTVVFDSSFSDYRPVSTCLWFYNLQNLKTIIGIANLNTANMKNMFRNCTALTTIYVGEGWNTDKVTTHNDMFAQCTGLVGGQGTVYDANHVDITYAHIDGGPDNPGYFTEIPDGITVPTTNSDATDKYYTLDGKRISGKPLQKGLYIRNGKKVTVGAF